MPDVTAFPFDGDGLPFDDGTTLVEAREWLRDRIDHGAHCPCCGQLAKVYRRKINAGMAVALIRLCIASRGDAFVHLPPIDPSHGDAAKMVHWGLIEEELTTRPDGGRAGYWRPTPRGRRWAHNRSTVPKFAVIYDGGCHRLDPAESWSVVDALAKRFDLDELWRGV